MFGIAVLLLLGSACEEGPGGTAGITGRVIVQQYDLYGVLFAEYPAADERVFLVYGQDSIVGDEVRTHFSGRYRFDFLRKGLYTVYVLSPCLSCPGGEQAITAQLEITQSGKLQEAPVLYIRQE
ncbi:MAG: hypothetical protein GC205_10080 [Bacteroidetes bacterium]|nr:hypothetical protein [Bacteroidota bacterium]